MHCDPRVLEAALLPLHFFFFSNGQGESNFDLIIEHNCIWILYWTEVTKPFLFENRLIYPGDGGSCQQKLTVSLSLRTFQRLMESAVFTDRYFPKTVFWKDLQEQSCSESRAGTGSALWSGTAAAPWSAALPWALPSELGQSWCGCSPALVNPEHRNHCSAIVSWGVCAPRITQLPQRLQWGSADS